jgi:hypothetical protein
LRMIRNGQRDLVPEHALKAFDDNPQ